MHTIKSSTVDSSATYSTTAILKENAHTHLLHLHLKGPWSLPCQTERKQKAQTDAAHPILWKTQRCNCHHQSSLVFTSQNNAWNTKHMVPMLLRGWPPSSPKEHWYKWENRLTPSWTMPSWLNCRTEASQGCYSCHVQTWPVYLAHFLRFSSWLIPQEKIYCLTYFSVHFVSFLSGISTDAWMHFFFFLCA